MSIWMLLISAPALKKKIKKKFHGWNFIAKLIRVTLATGGGVVSYTQTHCVFDTVPTLHLSLLEQQVSKRGHKG